MPLFADRFVADASLLDVNAGYALDLVSQQRVRIEMAPAGTPAEQREWLAACDDRSRKRPLRTPRLVDFGRVGETRRFEAWLSDDSRSGPLVANQPAPAMAWIERPSTKALAALFDRSDERRLRVAACWGPPGCGRTTLVEQLARVARIRGFVPIAAALIGTYLPVVTGRTLFIVDDDEGQVTGSSWLHATLHAPRAHVCLLLRREEVRGVDGFCLERFSGEQLQSAIMSGPGQLPPAHRVRRAAEQAHGLPGRFVRALFSDRPAVPASRKPALPRVAEQPVRYETAASVPLGRAETPERPCERPWPAPGELAALRRKVTAATRLIEAGRHAPAVRGLRQAMAALARRDAWNDATCASLTLSSALLDRGRVREAQRVLNDGREWAMKAGQAAALVDIATLAGCAWIDLGRLDEAERVLSGAVAAARATDDRCRSAAAATALARCLFWRGQYGESLASLESTADAGDPRAEIRRRRAVARAAAAQGDSAGAAAAVDSARALAAECDGGRWLTDTDYTSACVRLALGDLDGVDRAAAACMASARDRRRPMRVLLARLLQLEANRRRGRLPSAAESSALQRLSAAASPLTRARFELFRSLAEAPDDRAVLRRLITATGLKGLEVFGSSLPRVPGSVANEPFVDDVLGILRVCQHADDEGAVLADVCARVRDHLHAATVAFVTSIDRRCESIVSDGPRMDASEIADRAIGARMTIAPHRVRERLDAAAPVMYGGNVIGVLCARWTVGTPYDLSRAPAVLTLAATAAAPVLSTALVKRAQASPATLQDLLGVTPAIIDLRSAIERAAPAPFPVLIEAESGCGKELVARAIHRCGPRRDRTFATLNCAALPDDLVEAELFGHARGSFTGAVADRPGVFEEAHGGTLFLDEVGELSLRAQAKLLRVIQEGELRRIGENLSRRVDVRIVCATNRNLRDDAEAGRFRHDLLYRLDVIRIAVPPLRERRDDVAVLVDHYWTEAARRVASRATLAAETRAALSGYDWPGNVRELQNVLAALAVRSPKRGVILPTALPPHVAVVERAQAWHLEQARRTFEEGFVRAALMRSGGQRARAAAELGVTRQGLNKLMARLGID